MAAIGHEDLAFTLSEVEGREVYYQMLCRGELGPGGGGGGKTGVEAGRQVQTWNLSLE